jgi:hypothetical protein
MAVEVVVITGQVPMRIFQTFGQRVLGIPANEATSATGIARFTLSDNLGHTIDAGAQLDVAGQGFVTSAPLAVPAGATTGDVAITALTAGSAGSGLVGPVSLVSPTYTWVSAVALTGQTTGGVDGETGEEYVDRLPDELPTLSPKAILIEDFAALARRDGEVFRALAVDNYNPGPPIDTAAEGHVAVFPQNDAGDAVSSAAASRIAASLQDGRVLNLVVHVLAPTTTDLDVAFTAQAYPGSDAAAVRADAEQALRDYLSPTTWGVPADGDPEAWIDEPLVRRNDLLVVVGRVRGVRHVTALTLGAAGGALSTNDFTLAGPAALPRAIAITGTVTL